LTRQLVILFSIVGFLVLSPIAQADQFNLTLYPNSPIPITNIDASAPPAPGFNTSSWQAAVTSGSKSEVYIPISLLLPYSVTIANLASISYWTNKSGSSGDPDWTFYIYTAPTGSGDIGSWYHTRLNSEPYLTGTPAASDPSGAWHQWSTADPNNPMRFYDTGRNGGIFGTYTDPTLANLQSGPINWNSFYSGYANNTYDYRNDTISLLSLQTGSAWGSTFDGRVDGITLTLKNGDIATINLEAVPEPASIFLFGTLLASAVAIIRRRLT
jgi:hypothetical protein